MKKNNKIPAFPPEDYQGSIADWMTSLQEMGLWDGENPDWYGDLLITRKEYFQLLDRCES
ncbi:MAG: hypothetical protein AAFY41_00775 [Bacteroidota bacterium]